MQVFNKSNFNWIHLNQILSQNRGNNSFDSEQVSIESFKRIPLKVIEKVHKK